MSSGWRRWSSFSWISSGRSNKDTTCSSSSSSPGSKATSSSIIARFPPFVPQSILTGVRRDKTLCPGEAELAAEAEENRSKVWFGCCPAIFPAFGLAFARPPIPHHIDYKFIDICITNTSNMCIRFFGLFNTHSNQINQSRFLFPWWFLPTMHCKVGQQNYLDHNK